MATTTNSGKNKHDASAIVLTGGKSSRMGRPKALLPFHGEPLIVHIVRKLERLFSDIVVVAAPEQELPPLPATVIRDEIAYQGPVGGIFYGLRAAKKEVGFVTSCDVPFLNPPLVSHLIARIADHDVVVPHWGERLQPLLAVYRRSVLPFLQEQLDRGELRPIFLYKKVRTREIREAEIREFDPDGWSFLNMNTPEDYEKALERWEELRRAETEDLPACCKVELFGVARLRAKTSQVSLDLPSEATLAHVLSALARKLPGLVGPVITDQKNGLTAGNVCNVNGREFVRDPGFKVNPGDNLYIISSDAGG